jgi:hypothetical protein
MNDWPEGEIRSLAVEAIGERYRRYRLPDAAAEAAIASSMARYGQLSPLAVCLREEKPEVLDGFKRMAAGNQVEVVAAARREHLTAAEVHGVVDLIVACASRPQVEFVLHEPRRALRQAQIESLPAWDPRLSAAGKRVLRQLGGVLGGLGRMEHWLRHRGRADLSSSDRGVLSPSFQRLGRDACIVAELTEDLLTEMDVP